MSGAPAIHLVSIVRIRPSEMHYPEHAQALADGMRRTQIWSIPVVLERRSLVVMDGHHRVAAACLLNLKFVPCVLIDYCYVEVSARRPQFLVTPKEIVRRAKAADLYPPKTTRHRLTLPLPTCDISLSLLAGEGVPHSSQAIARIS